jgi:creatinine amidohydrolase
MSLNHWNELTRDELSELLPTSVVVLPTAATEQHGPHLATGHDAFMVSHIAADAADAAQRAGAEQSIVVAPCLAFGSSAHHLPFGGTLSLRTETYSHVVRDLVESMLTVGARKILLLNGHGGNAELNQLVARDVAIAWSASEPVAIAAASYWDIARGSLSGDARLAGFRHPGHAGLFETATMLALDPSRVREPRPERDDDPSQAAVIPGMRLEMTGWWKSFDGYTDSPAKATAELGDIILEHVISDVAEGLIALATTELF